MTRTPEQIKRRYFDSMGQELGSMFYELWIEVVWLHEKWEEYVELFGTDDSRVKLINDAASLFFYIVQDTLWDSTLLHIARLTDPSKSMNKANLSIKGLLNLIDNAQLKSEVSDLIEIADSKAAFCRDWRNKHIAHRDLDIALKKAESLPSASNAQVEGALSSIADDLNQVEMHYCGAESGTLFEGVSNLHGAYELLSIIERGLKT